ncbi:DUF1566 domain-containing protein [Legionella saoudiensis]|uniref:DUF1566 domain-containing protein n=1 Tax=Legionella saoudiensis TaxID=1750561 RepID=UPI000731924A|nr:DUF1566 domain-containing protein [Legionella saoudiensis]
MRYYLFLVTLIFASNTFSTTQSPNAVLSIVKNQSNALCNNLNLSCVTNITLEGCMATPGSITIKNNSLIPARNIQVSSTNSNFIHYVVQNNGCPAVLAPNAQCNISFATNANIAFYIANVLVKGSNTSSLFFNLNAFLCSMPHTVGGSVSGLQGTLVLQNNGTELITLNTNGPFTFPTPVLQDSPYSVTIYSQPANQVCTVTNGSGTMGTANVTNVQVNCVTNTTTLSTSVSDLALSVTGLTEYGVTGTPNSGVARIITISNTGSSPAVNFNVSIPSWPAGTASNTTNCNAPLLAGDSCTITITPGATASSDGANPCSSTGTSPIPSVITAQADNALPVTSNVVILNYGCIYQDGYVFAFDDTTPNTSSVGGKLAAIADETTPLQWSLADSVTGATDISDGQTNTALLANPPGDFPAAQSCLDKITPEASNWYLPAICEFGYDALSLGSGCGSQAAPLLQNIHSNLFDNNIGNLSTVSFYWTSTELDITSSRVESFPAGGQGFINKSNGVAVRCVRTM